MTKYLDSAGLQNFATLVKSNTVSVNAQTLTDTQKARARTNIGAGTSSFSGSYSDLTNKPTIPTVTDTYSATGTAATSGKAVAAALGTLDVTGATVAASKTISGWSETDGKVSISTQDISITKSLISDFPTIPAAAANGTYSVKTKVGDTTTTVSDFTANQSTADDVTFVLGSNITLTPDATNRKITIASTDTNTTYSFTGGTNKFTVTPSNGSAFDVTVTPSIANNVTGSGLTADKIVLGNGSSAVKTSSKGISTTAPSSSSDDTVIPTSKAVWTAISNGISTADAMIYKGTLDGSSSYEYGTLTPAANKGWTYKVATAGIIDGVRVEVGDLVICNTDNTAAATSSNYTTIVANWDFIQTNVDGALFKSANTFTDGHVLAADGTAGKVKDTGFTIGKSVPSNAVFTDTDTKVTSVGNHYTPAADASAALSANATGASAAWSIDVVKGVTLSRDAKGHVTAVSVTSGKIPANPNTDRYVNSAAFDTSIEAAEEVAISDYGSSGATLTKNGSTVTPIVNEVYKITSVPSSGAGGVTAGDYIRVTSLIGSTSCWFDKVDHYAARSQVKMTLTRAGSDTATVVANIPEATLISAGVMSASDKQVINDMWQNKADKSSTVTSVYYNTTDNIIKKTVNGSSTNVVTAQTIVDACIGTLSSTEITNAWNAG